MFPSHYSHRNWTTYGINMCTTLKKISKQMGGVNMLFIHNTDVDYNYACMSFSGQMVGR